MRRPSAMPCVRVFSPTRRSSRTWRAAHRPRPETYPSAGAFLHDLRLLQSSVRARAGRRLAEGRLGTLIAQAEIFGFHLASLDLRQHAERHTAALAEVFGRYGVADDWSGCAEERRAELLTR